MVLVGPPSSTVKPVEAGWLKQHGTNAYVGFVVATCVLMAAFVFRRDGWPSDIVGLVVLSLLGALAWWLPTSSDGRSHFTADNVVVLAAIPVVGVLGAGIVGMAMTGLTTRRLPLRRRVFNMAMHAISAMVGGFAYALAGGTFSPQGLDGSGELLWHVGIPIVVADIVNLTVNAILVAGVIRISEGVPLRLQLIDMVTSSGLTQFAYGIIAFLVVVMWLPGELGPVAVLIGLAPLAGARWALLQYGEEREARERALGALVAAIETRAPELEGHSARVSALAGHMAQDLGLGPKEVADVRTAGMLHDLGRVVVAPGHEGVDAERGASRRGAAMLQALPFLSGATDLMHQMASGDPGEEQPTLGARLVSAADQFDLSIHGERPLSVTDALALVTEATTGPDAHRIAAALARAVQAANVVDAEAVARA